MNSLSSENRLADSRICFLEQSLKEISNKYIKIQHNLIAVQGKEQYLQNAIQNLANQVQELKTLKNEQPKYGLTDITRYSNSVNKKAISKENLHKTSNFNSNAQFMQLFQSLQASTINNLEQLEDKIHSSYQSIQSKCSNMELRMLGIWKQAQSLIQNLTFEVETTQLKTKAIEDRTSRDRQIISNTIQSFQNQLFSLSHTQATKFSQQLTQLRSSLQNQIQSLSHKFSSLNIQSRLDQIKNDLQSSIKKNNEKIIDKVQTKLQENLQNSSTFGSDIKLTIQSHNTKIDQLEKELQETNRKLKEIEKEVKDKIVPRDNWRNKFKENSQQSTQKKQDKKESQKFISLNNSEGAQDPWSSNSIENASKKQQTNKPFQTSNKKPNPNQNFSNPLDKGFDKGFGNKNKLIGMERHENNQKNQEKEGEYARGIAGLRNMRKKEEQRKSTLQRNRPFYDQPKAQFDLESRNPLSRGGNLRQLPGLESPSKMQSQKALPPLSSEKGFPRNNSMQRQTNVAPYQNYMQSPDNDSDGSESYFVDQEGFLIDKDRNRLINQNGEEVQLSYEDIERLREMQEEQNQ